MSALAGSLRSTHRGSAGSIRSTRATRTASSSASEKNPRSLSRSAALSASPIRRYLALRRAIHQHPASAAAPASTPVASRRIPLPMTSLHLRVTARTTPVLVHRRRHLRHHLLKLIVQDLHRWIGDHLPERPPAPDDRHPLQPALVVVLRKLPVLVADPHDFEHRELHQVQEVRPDLIVIV